MAVSPKPRPGGLLCPMTMSLRDASMMGLGIRRLVDASASAWRARATAAANSLLRTRIQETNAALSRRSVATFTLGGGLAASHSAIRGLAQIKAARANPGPRTHRRIT